MYVRPNFKTKKMLKEAVVKGEPVEVYSPGPFPITREGREYIEGPHFPEPHRWYAKVDVHNGLVIKVLS